VFAYVIVFIYTYLKAGKLTEFAVLWNMSPCCLAADVSNEPTVSVICVDDQGTVTVVTVSVPHYTPSPNFLVTTTVNYMRDVHAMVQGSVAGLLSRRPGFDCRTVYVTAVVDKVELGQVILRVLLFSPVMPLPYTPIPLI
jgi:hypothetical protein